jgi:hypothetical protein
MPKNPPTGFAAYPRLGDCAKANMLIVCSCRQCRRTVTYLAADLLDYFRGLDQSRAERGFRPYARPLTELRIVGELWRKCPRCGATREWSETERYAKDEDVGHTMIRRPNGFRMVQIWRNEWFGPGAREGETLRKG